MALTINKNSNGLGRSLPGTSHVSGLLFYSNTLPSGFSSNNRIKKLYSLRDAVNLGIAGNSSDETKHSTGGTVLMTAVGSSGDVSSITVGGGVLGSYTHGAGETTSTLATALAAAINANTFKHGWTATSNTATVTVVPPSGLGALSMTLAFVTSGTAAATVTQLSGGASSKLDVLYYFISEFFRINSRGVLYVGVYAEGTYTGAEIKTLQDYSGGEINQIAVYTGATFASGLVTASQTYIDTLYNEGKPVFVTLAADFTSLSLATLPNLTTLDSEGVNVGIGIDGYWTSPAWSASETYVTGTLVSFLGKVYSAKSNVSGASQSPLDTQYWSEISYNYQAIFGKSVPALGTELGVISAAKVSENIGWVQKFNLAGTNVFQTGGLVFGTAFTALTEAQKIELNNKHYTFIETYFGISGSYFTDSWTCTLRSSDYATIENNRTMNALVRSVRPEILPLLKSPLFVTSAGKLTNGTLAIFDNATKRGADVLVQSQDISAYSVLINPDQDVLTTSQVVVTLRVVPVGVAREIVVNIGFVTSL